MAGRIAYVNGRFLPRLQAGLSIEDRASLFADGVYEVVWLRHGKWIDGAAHLARLSRSLQELSMRPAVAEEVLLSLCAELVRLNHAQRGDYALYIQVSRGGGRRNHLFPAADTPSSLVLTLTPIALPGQAQAAAGVAMISLPDQRWARRDIKSIALLANVLARQKAAEAGAREAMLIDPVRGVVTEGSTANIFLLKGKTLITHPADTNILNGVTRLSVLKLAKDRFAIEERAFTPDEARAADGLFITSTTAGVLPVSRLDGAAIPVPPALLELYETYHHYTEAAC